MTEYDPQAVADIAVDILSAPPEPDGRFSYDLSVIYLLDDLLSIVEKYRRDALDQVLINTTARSEISTFPVVAQMLIKHKPEEAAKVLAYLIREVQQASYLASVIGILEKIDSSALSVSLLEENPYLSQPWENWEGENCHKMIDFHVESDSVRDRLKQQCH